MALACCYFRLLSIRFRSLTVVRLSFRNLGPQEEEWNVGAEQVYEEEHNPGHFADQGKPPQPTLIPITYISMFCLQE